MISISENCFIVAFFNSRENIPVQNDWFLVLESGLEFALLNIRLASF